MAGCHGVRGTLGVGAALSGRFGRLPQDALNAPRWQWTTGKKVDVEHGVPYPIMQELTTMGHDLNILMDPRGYGKGPDYLAHG